MPGSPTEASVTRSWLPWRRPWVSRDRRTWMLMVPLHLVAFLILYFATYQLMQSEVVGGITRMARERLRGEILELLMLAQAHPGQQPGGHQFAAFMAIPRPYQSQLYATDGSLLAGTGSRYTPSSLELGQFLESGRPDTYRVQRYGSGEFVNGLSRIAATQSCAPCHEPGEILGIATMNLDVTDQLGALKGRLRQNLALLILVWASALGVTTAAVKRSAKRSARDLEEELAAAQTGEPAAKRASALALDPVTERLHRSVLEFLEHQRQHRSEMASRLAHTDQLASVGRLAAGLAHEIKNPLAGIQGALEILQQDAENESNRDLYGEMLSELKRVNETLHLMLSSARPSPVQLADTDVRALLEELRTLLEPSLRRQGTTLRLETASELEPARIDAAKIRQVLVNLINNAADAMESGGTVTIRAAPLANGDRGLVLGIQDDGPGIPEEQRQRIFEPFFSTKFTGTGLGLAIARSLVEQHGGTLEVQSEVGSGSTFLVLLPAPEDEAATAGAAGAA